MKISIQGNKLNDLVTKHKIFIDRKGYKEILEGINIKIEDNLIKLCTLDSLRLLYTEFKVESEEILDITVPLPKLKYEKLKPVEVEITKDGVTLKQNTLTEVLKPLSNEFIKYNNLFAYSSKFGIAVDPKLLMEALGAFKNEGHVYLQMSEPYSPIEITSKNNYSIVLPVRTQKNESWLRHGSENWE